LGNERRKKDTGLKNARIDLIMIALVSIDLNALKERRNLQQALQMENCKGTSDVLAGEFVLSE